MIEKLQKLVAVLQYTVIFAFIVFFFYALVSGIFTSLSVTAMNITLGIITMTLGTGLFIAGAMANDSNKGGFFIHTFQFLTLSYPLTYLIGLVSSIMMLYSELDDKEVLAFWLSSMSGFHLLIIIMFFSAGLMIEDYKQKQ